MFPQTIQKESQKDHGCSREERKGKVQSAAHLGGAIQAPDAQPARSISGSCIHDAAGYPTTVSMGGQCQSGTAREHDSIGVSATERAAEDTATAATPDSPDAAPGPVTPATKNGSLLGSDSIKRSADDRHASSPSAKEARPPLGSTDGYTRGRISPRSRASPGWEKVRSAVTRELHVGDLDLLRDVLVSPRGGTPRRGFFGQFRCCRPRGVRVVPVETPIRNLRAPSNRLRASYKEIGRWCCVAAKPTIPARNRGTVRSIVYRDWRLAVIDPESRFASIWKGVVFAAIICQAVLVPLRVGFDSDVADPLWRPMRNAADRWFVILDLIFVADIILSCYTGYIENGNKVVDRTTILRRALLQVGFVLDIVAVIPYDVLVAAVLRADVACPGLFSTRLTRLLHCRKLPKLFAEAEDAGGIHFRNLHQVFKILVFIVLLVHFDACMWFRLSLERGFSTDETGDSFLAPQMLASVPFHAKYGSSLYWSVRQATGEGIGGGPQLNDALENAFSMFVTLSGILLTSFMIGAVARLVSQFDASWTQHSERLVHLHRFLAHSGLSKELGRDISAYYEFSFAESGGRNAKEVVGQLSSTLQGHLSVVMTHAILRNVPLFQDVEEGLVVSLAKSLSSLTAQRGELVMRAGLRCRRVFLVHWGSLDVEVGGSGEVREDRIAALRRVADMTDAMRSSAAKSPWAERLLRRATLTIEEGEEDDALHDDEHRPGEVVERLSAGSFFGQYVEDSRGYLPSTSVRANTFCILFVLEHETLRMVLPRYPRSRKRIERLLARKSTNRAGSLLKERQARRSVSSGARPLAAISSRFPVCVLRVQRRTQQCCARRGTCRGFSRTPCAWLVRDCLIPATSSSCSNAHPLQPAVSPSTQLRSHQASRYREAGTTRRTPSGGVVDISASPGRRFADALPFEAESGRWWQARDTQSNSPSAISELSSPVARASQTQVADGCTSSPVCTSCVINPHSNFRWTWQVLMQLSVLYTLLTVPLYLAFRDSIIRGGKSILGTLDAVVNLMYLCDLLVRARMAAYARGVLVTDPTVLLRVYVTAGGFWKDAVSSVPLDWLFAAAWWTRINKLGSAPRLLSSSRTWLTELTSQSSSSRVVASTLLHLVFLLFVSFHYLTCVYWVFAMASRDSEPIWHEDTFSAPVQLDDESVVVQYMYSFYRVAHPGGLLRDTLPSTGAAVWFALVITIYGLFLFAYIIGAIGAAIADTDATAARFRRRKLAVERFLHMRRVPTNVRELVSHWFRVEWQNHNGLTLNSICSNLPKGLQRRVRLELCGNNLRRAPVFVTMNKRLLTRLADVVRIEMLVENQVVFHAGELGSDLFVVVGGAVSMYFDEDGGQLVTDIAERILSPDHSTNFETGVSPPARWAVHARSPTFPVSSVDELPEEMLEPFATVGPGDMGGELAYFEGLRLTTAIAVCATEAYFISYDALHELLSQEPFLEARLRVSSRRKLLQVAQIAKNIWRKVRRAGRRRSHASPTVTDEDTTPSPPYDGNATTSSTIVSAGMAHGRGAPSGLLSSSVPQDQKTSRLPVEVSGKLGARVQRERPAWDTGYEAAGVAKLSAAASDLKPTAAEAQDIPNALRKCTAASEETGPGGNEAIPNFEAFPEDAETSRLGTVVWRPPSFADSGSLATVHFGDVATRMALDPLGFPEADDDADSARTPDA